MAYIEKTIKSELIYKGRVITVYKDEVQIEEKNINSTREVVIHNGGVCAVCKTKENKIKFVRQYRYPFKEVLLELPAGKIEKGEKPDETIIREVEEEVGAIPNNITYIGRMYCSPGFSSEIIYLYYVSDYNECETHFDPDEELDIYEYSYEEALQMIESGEIVDAKTICLLLRVRDYFINK